MRTLARRDRIYDQVVVLIEWRVSVEVRMNKRQMIRLAVVLDREFVVLTCWVEAMVAARTDKSLKRVVADTDASSLSAMRALGAESSRTSGTSDNKNTSRVEDIVELTVYLLRGLDDSSIEPIASL